MDDLSNEELLVAICDSQDIKRINLELSLGLGVGYGV